MKYTKTNGGQRNNALASALVLATGSAEILVDLGKLFPDYKTKGVNIDSPVFNNFMEGQGFTFMPFNIPRVFVKDLPDFGTFVVKSNADVTAVVDGELLALADVRNELIAGYWVLNRGPFNLFNLDGTQSNRYPFPDVDTAATARRLLWLNHNTKTFII